MRQWMDRLQACIWNRKRYFREAGREIAERNLHQLKRLSLVAAVMLLLFGGLAQFVWTERVITPYHGLFFGVCLVCWAVFSLYEKKGTYSGGLVTVFCLAFEAALFVSLIPIDVILYSDTPGVFVPALFVSLPALLILPTFLNYLMIAGLEAVYIAAVCLLKEPDIGRFDIYHSLVGVVFSVVVVQLIMRLRIREHEVRTKYQQLSMQDALSGILNKKASEEAARRYLETYDPQVSCALLVLDIDDFKLVNDRLGHYTGDVLLHTIGKLLSETFRSTDVVGRFGGDEFMVLVKGALNQEILEEKCRVIQNKFLGAAENLCSMRVTCSIGGVWAVAEQVVFERLFRQADDALYQAKAIGKDRYILHAYTAE